MRTTTPPPKKPPPSRVAWWIGGGVIALAIAFGAGRLTSEPEPAPRHRPEREVAQAPAYDPPAQQPSAWTQPVAPAPPPPAVGTPAAPEPPAPPSRAAVPPERMAQYRTEVEAHVEEQRQRVVSTCWPKEGLPKGQRSTTVTYNVTFDPQGREIGRGIVQDRRAPAGKFGKCLGQLQGRRFTISPPGRHVTLRVPVTYP